MLQQLFHTLLVSFTCLIWGLPLLFLNSKFKFKDNFWFTSFTSLLAFLFFSGCITIGILSSWFVLFLPLKFLNLAILTVILFLVFLITKREDLSIILVNIKKTKNNIPVSAVFYSLISLILFLGLGSILPVNHDTQIYHYQIIKWQETYGTVPGIANLLPRFGQGSNWFNLISFFNLPFLKNDNYTALNISFVSWSFIWLLSKWNFHYQLSKNNVSNRILAFYYFLLFVFFMADWQLFRDAANSTNYDFEVTTFLILIFSFLFETSFKEKKENNFSPILILFALSVISFKFSGVFILLFIIYYLIINYKFSRWILTALAGTIIILPILIRNYITSGYPLFPFPYSISNPDWQLPYELANGNYYYILDYNRFFNYWMLIGKIPDTPFNWVPYWFKGILIQHKVVLILALSSTFLFFLKLNYIFEPKKLRHLLILLLIMIAGWFFSAPDPARFGYGFLLPAAFISLSIAFSKYLPIKFYNLLIIVMIIAVSFYSFKKINPVFQNPERMVYPESAVKPALSSALINGINFNIPKIINGNWDHRCYNTDLPCLPGWNPFIKPRGNSLKDGFRMEAITDTFFIKNYNY